MGKFSFFIGLFLLPSAIALSIIFLLFSLIISFWNDLRKLINDRINLIYVTSCLLLLISAFFNFFDKNSINNLSNNSSLIFIGLLNWVPLIFAFIGFQKYLLTNNDRKKCILIFIFGSIPVIFSCFAQFILNWFGPMETLYGLIVWYQRPIDGITGITGLFNNPNYLAAWLNLIWPFSLAFIFFDNKNKVKILFKILLIFSISLLIILTASRAGWLCLLLPIFIIYAQRIKLWILTFISGISFITLFLTSSLFESEFRNLIAKIIPRGIWINFTNLEYANLDISRLGIWKYALNFISESPIFGHGSKSFTSLLLAESGIWKGHAHNLPLELMVNYGIPAALLILIPTTYLVIKAYLKLFFVKLNVNKSSILDRAWLISLTLLILMHLVDIQYFDGRISIAGWILLAGVKNLVLNDEIPQLKKKKKIEEV
ncbi:O-antigen ligase [uncultured Prochlorococcus sp.]|uniref:O-antigen ligase family protein n=1 Tax=uncultured Prochlorococcus sp. TaxID=159733 RepID=UPI00258E4A93|nr:O-antigen ligase family protein [uncultured Prochlorococcus sp.]